MCAIYGSVGQYPGRAWLQEQKTKALERGKDWTHIQSRASGHKFDLYHTRLATNDSKDKYPINIDGSLFAMNGIVSAHVYHKMAKDPIVTELYGYTVDSAYVLKTWLDFQEWDQFDSTDFVFAFWLIHDGCLYLGNKDFPLYIDYSDMKFSSFAGDGLAPLGNKVIKYDLRDKKLTQEYKFKELVYDQD